MQFSFPLRLGACLLTLLLAIPATVVSAPVISHQGYLTSPAGIPLTGNYSLTFRIFDVEADGAALWTEIHPAVAVDQGLFIVPLGSITPLPSSIFAGADRFLSISVNADPEMLPRRRVSHSFWACRADKALNADSLGGHTPQFFLNWANFTGVPAGFADGVDDIGSGDITAVDALDPLSGGGTTGALKIGLDSNGIGSGYITDGTIMNADINSGAAISTTKISGTAMNLSSAQAATGAKSFDGEFYIADSILHANPSGIVIGTTSFNPSSTYLVNLNRTYSVAASRYGLYCDMDNYSTGAVYGLRSRASGTTAGAANSGDVYAVYGTAISDGENRYAGYFTSRSRTTTLATGTTTGIYAEAQYGGSGKGGEFIVSDVDVAWGLHVNVSGNGDGTGIHTTVEDNTLTVSAVGCNNFVLNNAGTAYGVSGTVGNNASTGYAVYGFAYGNSTNWAGYFAGDVNVTGNIFMPAKITRIDHPTDPENQNLQLAGVDAPELLVTHSGNVTTDAAGEARVALPDYFALIAGDFRYNLTVIGQFAQAIISEEVSGGAFTIKTDKPNVKVSWTVTGARLDGFAKSRPLVNVVAKPKEHRGMYLHPEAFGQPIERGVNYLIQQDVERKRPANHPRSNAETEPTE